MIRKFSALIILIAPFSFTYASHHPSCPDESYFTVTGNDGNRYGWFENATCVFEETEVHRPEYGAACPDESYFTVVGGDGIKYGWFQETTCIVEEQTTDQVEETPVEEAVDTPVVVEPVQPVTNPEQPESELVDPIFASIAGVWETTFSERFITALEINEDGTFVEWSFENGELFGFDAEISMNFRLNTDEALAAAGYTEAQIEIVRTTPFDCWVMGTTGSYTHLGDNVFDETSQNLLGAIGFRTIMITVADDNLLFGVSDSYPLLEDEISECQVQ